MTSNTPLHWEPTSSSGATVSLNVATTPSPSQWLSFWSQPTAIRSDGSRFVFDIQVARIHDPSQAYFGFTPSSLIPTIQSQPNNQHIGPGALNQTLGFGLDGAAYLGPSVIANCQPAVNGTINHRQPFKVELTVDTRKQTIACDITQDSIRVQGSKKFAQCGLAMDNIADLRVLIACLGCAQGDAIVLHQRMEKSAGQKAADAKAAADAEANRLAAARPLLESAELAALVSGSLFTDCKRTVTDVDVPVRVAVVGKMGVGKSSVITLLLSAFQDDNKTRIVRRAKVASQDDHVTTAVTEYRLAAETSAATGGVVLVDTWGYSDDNWSEFLSFLDGKLMHGYEKGCSMAPRSANLRSSISYADRIHAVIFVVSAQEADADADGRYAQRLRFFINACNQQEVPFLLVATKADELVRTSASSSSASPGDDGGEMFDAQLLFRDANVVAAVQRISKHTGVPRGQIYPVKGYTHETVRNSRMETTALRALAEAVELAVESYDERERQRLRALVREASRPDEESGREGQGGVAVQRG